MTMMKYAVILVLLASGSVAHADQARGEALQKAGIAAAQAKDWALARKRFEESYAEFPKPVVLYNLATAQEQTDLLIAARATYIKFLEKTLPGDDDEKWRVRAKAAIADLDKSIPTLKIRLTGFTASVVVELDGRALASSELEREIPLDPGEHLVVALRGTEELARRPVLVGRGSRAESELVAPPPKAVLPPPKPTPITPLPPPTKPVPRDDGGGVLSSPWFWTIAGVAVLGAAGAGYYYFVYEPPIADPTPGTLGTITR
jgi:hypothetical protein